MLIFYSQSHRTTKAPARKLGIPSEILEHASAGFIPLSINRTSYRNTEAPSRPTIPKRANTRNPRKERSVNPQPKRDTQPSAAAGKKRTPRQRASATERKNGKRRKTRHCYAAHRQILPWPRCTRLNCISPRPFRSRTPFPGVEGPLRAARRPNTNQLCQLAPTK